MPKKDPDVKSTSDAPGATQSHPTSRPLAFYNRPMGVIIKDPDILGGTPTFRGTRVPIQTLFDYLEGGETLEDFLEGFPTVSREMAITALEETKHVLLPGPKMRILMEPVSGLGSDARIEVQVLLGSPTPFLSEISSTC